MFIVIGRWLEDTAFCETLEEVQELAPDLGQPEDIEVYWAIRLPDKIWQAKKPNPLVQG